MYTASFAYYRDVDRITLQHWKKSMRELLLCCLGAALYLTITSSSTPSLLAALFPGQTAALETLRTAETRGVDLLVDASYEELSTASLSALCRELQIPLLVLGPVVAMSEKEWTYYLGGIYSQEAVAIDSALRCLPFHAANLLGDASNYSLRLMQALHSLNSTVVYSDFIVADEDSAEAYVGRVMRPTGNRMTVFTTTPHLTKRLLKAQFSMHIGGTGYANLLPAYSARYSLDSTDAEDNLRNGNLIATEREELLVNTEEDKAKQLYELIRPYLTLKSSDAKALLDSVFPTHIRSSGNYILANLQNFTRVLVGEVSRNSCSLTASISFLGGSLNLSQTSAAAIPVSGNFGQMDPSYGYIESDTATYASLVAFAEINTLSSFLPNFHIDVWNFTGGVMTFDEGLIEREVMPYKEKLGSAILTNVASANTMPLIKYLRAQGVTTPVVGSSNTDTRLSSQANYPNFIRVCLNDDYVNIVMVQTIKRLGWTKCSLLVVDLEVGLQARIAFRELMSRSGIDIVNSPEYQVISASVTNLTEARANFTEAFQHIIATRCRVVVVISVQVSYFIPLVFYELGMRKGDLIVFGREWITPFTFTDLTEIEIQQVAEVMYGSLQLSPDFYIGRVGQAFKAKYYQLTQLPPSSYPCMYYDAAFTIGHALNWLLFNGKDFFNSTAMIKSLRNVRFVGCTGLVYFEANTNDRQSMRYTLDTLQYNVSTGLYLRRLGVYDPAGMVLLTIDSTFTWGDGNTKVPSDIRNSSFGCPFEDRQIQPFEQGRNMLIGVCMAFFLLAACVGLLVWWIFRSPLELLTERKPIESDDMLVLLTLLVELVQSIALAHNSSFAQTSIHHILPITIGDFTQARDLQEEGFQHLWLVTVCLVSCSVVVVGWLHCCVVCLLGDGVSRVLLELWTFIFANWLFVPIGVILLSSFECIQAVGNEGESAGFASSYLESDCFQPCWDSKHTAIAVLSAVTLVLNTAATLLYRPIWQASRSHLNIKSSMGFLCSTPAFQVLLVGLYVSIRKEFPKLYSILYLLLWGFRFISCVLWPAYGYQRTRLRHLFTTLVVLWTAFISLCRTASFPGQSYIYLTLQLSISALILAAGEAYILLKVPNFLYRPKGVDTFHLYKFAFKPASPSIIGNLQRELQRAGSRCVLKTYYLSEIRRSEVELSGNEAVF